MSFPRMEKPNPPFFGKAGGWYQGRHRKFFIRRPWRWHGIFHSAARDRGSRRLPGSEDPVKTPEPERHGRRCDPSSPLRSVVSGLGKPRTAYHDAMVPLRSVAPRRPEQHTTSTAICYMRNELSVGRDADRSFLTALLVIGDHDGGRAAKTRWRLPNPTASSMRWTCPRRNWPRHGRADGESTCAHDYRAPVCTVIFTGGCADSVQSLLGIIHNFFPRFR